MAARIPAELKLGCVTAVIDTHEQLPLDLSPLRTEDQPGLDNMNEVRDRLDTLDDVDDLSAPSKADWKKLRKALETLPEATAVSALPKTMRPTRKSQTGN